MEQEIEFVMRRMLADFVVLYVVVMFQHFLRRKNKGLVAELADAVDSKSTDFGRTGSSPVEATRFVYVTPPGYFEAARELYDRRLAQLGEQHHDTVKVAGSNPASPIKVLLAIGLKIFRKLKNF